MANVDRPNGFSFAKSLIGAPVQGLERRYVAADRSADTTGNHGDIYIGDPVTLVGGAVLPANSGDEILGVVVGVGNNVNVQFGDGGMFKPNALEERFLRYDEDGYVWIVPARDSLFEIQSAVDLDLVVGAAADHNVTAATAHGSRVTGVSNAELVASVNSDVTVVEIKESPDNDTTLANARYFVKFNNIFNAYS
jgi:hypothetical protein